MIEIPCDKCGAEAAAGYYDDLTGRYFCDDQCFLDWADENFEEVVDFYRRMNID